MSESRAALQKRAFTDKSPKVLKVDPPNWWIGHTLNPVRLLIRGNHLQGARIDTTDAGLKLGPVKINDAGTYLFVDVTILSKAAPGKRMLQIHTQAGKTEVPFDLMESYKASNHPRGFSSDDVIYLIMPDRFASGNAAKKKMPDADSMIDRRKPRSYHGGNLQGIIDHLSYLRELAVTAIWLTPIYANRNTLHPKTSWSNDPFTDYHGYGPIDYYGLDAHFGDMAKLRELVEKARSSGIKIILDQVFNHTGPEHPWVQDPPTRSWYHGTLEQHIPNPYQPWMLADPYATSESLRPMLDGWFGDMLPDLNQEDPEVARYLIQNMLWWMGMTGVDGLRFDVLSFVPRIFWKECFLALKREFPDCRTVGEVNGDLPATVSHFQGGKPGSDGIDTGLDSAFDFPLRKAMRAVFLDGMPIEELAATLSQDRLYSNPDMLVTCFGLHDDSRFMGHAKATPDAIKLVFAFLLTTRGIPLIYYGDEIAMPGGEDPDNRRDFPGGWPDDSRNAFERAGLKAEEEFVFKFVKALTHLRSQHDCLRRGRLMNLMVNSKIYAYARRSGSEQAIVILNNGSQTENIDMPVDSLRLSSKNRTLKDHLGNADCQLQENRIKVKLPMKTAVLYLINT